MALEVLELPLRHAKLADVPRLEALVAESMHGLDTGFYSDAQIDAALHELFAVDTQLIEDRTYYLVDSDDGLVACGGWSKRGTLFSGDRKRGVDHRAPMLDPRTSPARLRGFFVHPAWARRGLGRRLFITCRNAAEAAGFKQFEVAATAPCEPFYAHLGFQSHERLDLALSDSVVFPVVRMTRRVS